MTYLLLKFLHVFGATVLLARTARVVVIADALFTAAAIVAQPITGYLLMREIGAAFLDDWIAGALVLYVVAGVFWLPVVWIQIRMRDLAAEAAKAGLPLPTLYHRLFRVWFAFGFPGFGAVMGILWLMIAKPA